jgi:protein TonB
MFELVERNVRDSGRRTMTVFVSIVLHVVIIGAFIVVPLLYMSDELPTPHEVINAFAAAPPAPTPPPPPPPPAPATTPPPKPVATTGQQQLAPVAPPNKITTPAAPPAPSNAGVPGGVPGGIAGGVVGGVVGGIPNAPPAAPSQAPVRVGGQIKAPDLVHRVEPRYPPIAQNAHVGGTVVLEAVVAKTGQVQSVRVLRGIPMLNDAAAEAVKQWRYSPLMLNGQATPFILTVTVTFRLQ